MNKGQSVAELYAGRKVKFPLTPFIMLVIAIVMLIVLMVILHPHFYFMKQVKEDQIGIKIRGGKIVGAVPPGIYNDVGLYVRLDTYSTQEYKFESNDPEVVTLDQQRIGVTVSGSVFRPTIGDVERLWIQYRSLYASDEALAQKLNQLSMQAMKVCVGDRLFADSVIGSDRDALRQCIDDELNKLASPFGLTVMNVVVPNVTLNPDVQAKMDMITQSRLDTEKAAQDKLKAKAEADAKQAAEEGRIRVEMATQQETARQQLILAQLEKDKLEAQQAVISAQKANDLLAAQKELEIAQAKAKAAAEQAKADLAEEITLAALYAENPGYLQSVLTELNASAIKSTDKIIFTQAGVVPNLVVSSGVLPTLPIGETAP